MFSAERLLYDIETKEHVQRIVRGIDGDCDPDRCLRDVVEGVEERTFAALETTRESHRRVYWQPTLFDRTLFSAWKEAGAHSIRPKAHAMVEDLLRQFEYELDPSLRRELDRILAAARRSLG